MSRALQFIVEPAGERSRLDRYLADRWPTETSRTMVQRVIEAGAVEIDGRRARANEKLRAGQTIVVRETEPPAPDVDGVARAEPIPLDIVYEDDALLVVNKPAGLVTHPAPGHWSGTLVNALLWHLESKIPRLARAGIVHRLDKDTSGLLMVAKTDAALREMARQLKDRALSRGYLALTLGHPPFDEGTIDAPIGRHATHRKEMSVRYLGGREAVTHYRVLRRCEAAQGLRYAVLRVRLQTGRTHQIRVHLAQLGYPILGDPVYGRRPASLWHSLGIQRQLLHARTLRFAHPTTHNPIALEAPIPQDMLRWLPLHLRGRQPATNEET